MQKIDFVFNQKILHFINVHDISTMVDKLNTFKSIYLCKQTLMDSNIEIIQNVSIHIDALLKLWNCQTCKRIKMLRISQNKCLRFV